MKKKLSKKQQKFYNSITGNTLFDRLHAKFITTSPTPAAAEWKEWDNIHAAQKKNHPIAFFLFNDVYYYLSHKKRRLSDAVWWVKYRTMKKHKYHLIDTKLDPGYHDTDHVIFHGCFSAFEDFIEKDIGIKGVKWQRDYYKKMLDEKNWEEWERKHSATDKKKHMQRNKERCTQYTEMLRLYDWWKSGRKKDHAKTDQMWDKYNALKKKRKKDYSSDDLIDVFSENKADESRMIREISEYENSLTQKDNDNLVSLVKLRGLLWN